MISISSISPMSKGMAVLFGLPLLLAIVFVTYFTVTGEQRMRDVCALLVPGMSVAEVGQVAGLYHLTMPDKDAGVTDLREARNFGRHRCRVSLAGGVVSSAAYHLAD